MVNQYEISNIPSSWDVEIVFPQREAVDDLILNILHWAHKISRR